MSDVEVNTVFELVQEVQNSKTGGYEVDFNILPNTYVASGTKAAGDRTFWTVIEVTFHEPDLFLSGQYWFWADGTVMQVL